MRALMKWVLWFLLIATFLLVLRVATKEPPQFIDKSAETAIETQKVTSLAAAFAKEYLTYKAKDTTYEERLSPYIGTSFQYDTDIDLKYVQGSQTVSQVWVDSLTALTNEVDIVQIGAVAVYKNGEKTTSRIVLLNVPVEKLENGRAVVNAPPAISPGRKNPTTKGVRAGTITTEDTSGIRSTVDNFMKKLTSDANKQDLTNFITGGFVAQPMDRFAEYQGIEGLDVYARDEGMYIAVVKLTIKDSLTGQISKPTYTFFLKQELEKYYITWMSNQTTD
ncbi:Conjugative transposon protein TcpC [compost metagenome]